jgi:hypothetical protein
MAGVSGVQNATLQGHEFAKAEPRTDSTDNTDNKSERAAMVFRETADRVKRLPRKSK